jgi:hypothetical protein
LAVRSTDPALEDLLTRGYACSKTFHRLADAIGETNTVVYVESGACAFGHLNGCLLPFMAATSKVRYLRIIVTRSTRHGNQDQLIALIGHELQHALEVAETPDVVDVDGMIDLYRRIGFPLKGRSGYETSAARAAGSMVFDELQAVGKPVSLSSFVGPTGRPGRSGR